MTTFTKLLLSAVCIILFSSISSLGQSAYPNSGVIKLTFDDLFPPSNQNTMGLNKLTPLEKEILRKHVENLLITAFRVGAQQSPPLEEQLRQGSGIVPQGSVIESKIDGEFEGWEGETVVKLMNGQIWQQFEYYYHYHYSFMSDVLIYNTGGIWKMKVEGIDKAVGVIQLK